MTPSVYPAGVPGRFRARLRKSAVASAAIAFVTSMAVSPAGAAPDPGSAVKVNQVAYVPGLPNVATLVNGSSSPLPWTLKNSAGATVASGQTTVKGADSLSGDNVHLIDFSGFDVVGTGYTLSAGGSTSYPFDISSAAVKKLRYDSLSFFYQQRSGIAIESQYVGSALARPAGHLDVWPNKGDTNVACRIDCGYTKDVRGGWYDAGDHGKYVVNGGISAWELQNVYERSVRVAGADATALGDGKLAIPEKSNGVPDILDESRWEVEWMLRMQAPSGLVHHKVNDASWTGFPLRPDQDPQTRLLSPVSTAATLNMAAVAAQASRLWKDFDPAFSAQALTAARTAYTAAKANPSLFASANDGTGSGPYDDGSVTDEFYWAAAELYTTTGDSSYKNDVTSSPLYKGASFTTRGYDWNWTGGLGDTTLALVPNGLPAADIATTKSAITGFADRLLNNVAGQGYPSPNNPGLIYDWGSNGQIANNAVVLGLAHDLTGQAKYRTGVFQAYDYLLGRNPLNQSYVTGYGEKPVSNPHHRFWSHQTDASFPTAPAGVLSGGPNVGLQDPVAAAQLSGCAPMKCYIDDIGAYSVNEVTVNWNSAFAWMANWAAEKAPADAADPTPTAGTVVGRGSGRCLDVQAAGTANSTPVQIYDCNGTGAQKWTRTGDTFVNANSGKCLDVQAAGTANGSLVQIYDCNGTGAQKWTVNPTGEIVNVNSGKCLDVSAQATSNGARLQIWDCNSNHSQANQLWTVS